MADTTGYNVSPSKNQSPYSIVNVISVTIVVGYIGLHIIWMFYPPKVPPEVLAILNQMMGAIGGAFATVIAFHLGSSRGAKELGDANRAQVEAFTAAATAAMPGGGPTPNGEPQLWADTIKLDTADAYRSYLVKYPAGAHANDATARLAAKMAP